MHVQPIGVVVRELLAAADPYYRGPHQGTRPVIDEQVRQLDPAKTRRDLGRDATEAAMMTRPSKSQLPR